jgi:hypothetical protein
MRFRRIDEYKNLDNNSSIPNVNQRLEYFHHYWNFLFQKNTESLFIYEEKFESHRSLINKINIQLDKNGEKYANTFNLYFITHPYFSSNNIILKKSSATNQRIQNVINVFNTNFYNIRGTITNNKCTNYSAFFKSEIKKIESTIISGDYTEKIIKNLITILHQNKPLNHQTKNDLKFLINATIIELYFFGYNLEHIKSIPNIILHPKLKKNSFPFNKKLSDFNNAKEYESYVEEEMKLLNLNKQIKSLLNLIKPPLKKGHYVFKIDGINLQVNEPIKIWNTTFYNPLLKLELNYSELNNDWESYVRDIEMYFDDYVKEEEKQNKQSTCNAIIETTYRPLYWNYSDKSLLDAYIDVCNALAVLKNLRHTFTGNGSNFGTVSHSNYILTDGNLKYIAAIDFQEKFNPPFEIKQEQEQSFKKIHSAINKINLDNKFQNNLANIYSNLNRLKFDDMAFNFKDYWTIFFESLFPNNPKDLISFIQKCYKHKLKKDFFVNCKCFLSSSLKSSFPFDGLQDYSLDEKTLKQLDLYIPLFKRIKATRFEKRFLSLKNHLQFVFLIDMLEELSTFKTHPESIFSKLFSWIEKTIYEVYSERNLETHNNISNDLSIIKLKEDFIHMTSTALQVSLSLCNKRTNSVEDILIKL